MHGEPHVLALLPQDVDHLGDRVLASGLGQSESGHDDDVLGLGQGLQHVSIG